MSRRRKRKHMVGGVTVRSGFEARCMDAARQHTDLEYEPDTIEYTITRKYTPDVKLPNGIYVEMKGRFKGEDRTKHRLVRAQHPELDIRIVFQKNDRLYKGAKSTYTEWCDRQGIPWAIGEIPKEWIDEPEVC